MNLASIVRDLEVMVGIARQLLLTPRLPRQRNPARNNGKDDDGYIDLGDRGCADAKDNTEE